MTKRKRPKARYVAREMSLNATSHPTYRWSVVDSYKGDGEDDVLCLYCSQEDARRIAAALNWHEAHKRGEL